jgi:hypothetical protein
MCSILDFSQEKLVLGLTWIDLDSEDETLRTASETTLKQEIAWANHLSIQVIFNPEI